MYDILLIIHNWFRWVVLILGIVAAVMAWSGWLGKRTYRESDRKIGSFFGISLDIQLLLGVILYFVSPLVAGVLANFSGSMSNSELRFIGLEHVFYMVVAVVCAHLGSILSRRAATDQAKFRRAALWFTVVLAIILLGIPWWRPLLRI